MTNETYQAPQLSLIGKLEDVTMGHNTGQKLDQAFNGGTPSGQLTFS